MKAEKLMIGDYIKHGFSGIGKITELSKGIVTVYDKGLDDGEGNCEVNFAENEIQPIPLTPEILEKNGFEYRPSWGEWVHYNPFPLIDFTLLTDEEGFHLDLPNAKIKYVHELQHVLRLCNIDKKIVL